jgi:hypothetical protein
MAMMAELTFFLCIQVKQMKQGTFIQQANYMKDLMKKFNMAKLKPVSTPMSTATEVDPDENGEVVDQMEYRSMIGSILYLTTTWLDIQFVVCMLSSFPKLFTSDSRSTDFQVYQIHTRTWDLVFRFFILDLVGFSNADFAGCWIDQKNTSNTCHFLISSLVCWSAHKQSSVAQSTTKVEYVAATSCCSQILWIVHTMRDYGVTYKSIPIMCDSSSAICLTQNPVFHGRVKHKKVRHHFLRNHVEKGDIEMKYIDTERQMADIFTKPLDVTHFASLWGQLGVCHPYGMV